MNRRSMGGRIYQEQVYRPKNISLNNPEQRNILYPIKGDTAFEPQEYGRKHYESPKHSAIHSIIFNEDYTKLME